MSVVKALFQKEMEGTLMTLEICYTVMHLLYVCPQFTFETKKQLLKGQHGRAMGGLYLVELSILNCKFD